MTRRSRRKIPLYAATKEVEVAIDAVEQATGVRPEWHQLLALARYQMAVSRMQQLQRGNPTLSWWSLRQDAHYQGLLRIAQWSQDISTVTSWAEILRQAYAVTQGRRRSRAQRAGRACNRPVFDHLQQVTYWRHRELLRLREVQAPQHVLDALQARIEKNRRDADEHFNRAPADGRCRRLAGHQGACER